MSLNYADRQQRSSLWTVGEGGSRKLGALRAEWSKTGGRWGRLGSCAKRDDAYRLLPVFGSQTLTLAGYEPHLSRVVPLPM